MHGDLLSPTIDPEWRRSGPFFLLAIALHIAVISLPGNLLPKTDEIVAEMLTVKLVFPGQHAEAPAPATPAPDSLPSKAIQQNRNTPAPQPVTRPTPSSSSTLASNSQQEIKVATKAVKAEADLDTLLEASAPAAGSVGSLASASANPANGATPAPVSPALFDAAYLNNPRPDYPRMSRRLGEEGKVLLRVRVRADGTASTVDLEKGSNFDRLDEAARQAVLRWRFVPAKRGNEAVEASVIVPIVFRLDS